MPFWEKLVLVMWVLVFVLARSGRGAACLFQYEAVSSLYQYIVRKKRFLNIIKSLVWD